jgi:hypothetical protein
MKKRKYQKLKDGEVFFIDPAREVFKFVCCDCGLAHTMAMIPASDDSGVIGISIERDNRVTAQLRRRRYGRLQRPARRDKFVLIRMDAIENVDEITKNFWD